MVKKALLFFSVICLFTGCSSEARILSEPEQKMLSYGAYLATRNHIGLDTLETGNKKEALTVLQEYWDLTNTETAAEVLDWLLGEGHRKDADIVKSILDTGNNFAASPEQKEIYAEIKEKYDNAKSILIHNYGYTDETLENIGTVSAWDYDRAVMVARWAYTAKLLSEKDAWRYIEKAVAMAQADYDNWDDYFAGIVLGRVIVNGADAEDCIPDAADVLLHNETSRWYDVAFDEALERG